MDPILYRPRDLAPTDLDARGRHADGRPYNDRVPLRLRAARPRRAPRNFWQDMVDWFTP